MTERLEPFCVRSEPHARPWAGSRLGPPAAGIGELWLAGPDSQVVGGPLAGQTLAALAASRPDDLLGPESRKRLGDRFPLLIKLLDTGDWLSVQVHPDDATAVALRGPSSVGKTEAWVVLDADPGAQLVIGTRADLSAETVRAAIRTGSLDATACDVVGCHQGDALLVLAGTIHAVGPGAFIYEIQEPSDLTFRVYDWGRPETPERPLHREEALAATRPGRRVRRLGQVGLRGGHVLDCEQFGLDAMALPGRTTRSPGGRHVEVLTTVRGSAMVEAEGWQQRLTERGSLVVPASSGPYDISSEDDGLVLIGTG